METEEVQAIQSGLAHSESARMAKHSYQAVRKQVNHLLVDWTALLAHCLAEPSMRAGTADLSDLVLLTSFALAKLAGTAHFAVMTVPVGHDWQKSWEPVFPIASAK